jgi:hypothetical protein
VKNLDNTVFDDLGLLMDDLDQLGLGDQRKQNQMKFKEGERQ